jgi:hypothetical protein
MTKAQLHKRLAQLELQHDQLTTELDYLDSLMRSIGFGGGLATVKATAHEIIDKGYLEQDQGDRASDK